MSHVTDLVDRHSTPSSNQNNRIVISFIDLQIHSGRSNPGTSRNSCTVSADRNLPGIMSNTSISVHVRIRPHKPSDGTSHPDDVLLTDRTVSVPSGNKHDPTQRLKFKLDACHGPESTQEEVFEKVKPM